MIDPTTKGAIDSKPALTQAERWQAAIADYRAADLNRYERIRWDRPHQCHDCKVEIGQLHVVENLAMGSEQPGYPVCDVEQCPKCFGQALSCPCELGPDVTQ